MRQNRIAIQNCIVIGGMGAGLGWAGAGRVAGRARLTRSACGCAWAREGALQAAGRAGEQAAAGARGAR